MKTDKELGDIGAKAAAEWLASGGNRGWQLAVNTASQYYGTEEKGRTAFAVAIASAVRAETPWGALGETQEAWLERQSAKFQACDHARRSACEDRDLWEEKCKEAEAVSRLNAAMVANLADALKVERSHYTVLTARLAALEWRPVGVKPTSAEVVLSSTWRKPDSRDQRFRLCRELYVRGVELYAMTPVLDAPIGTGLLVKGHLRGDEIQIWLNGHRHGPEKVTSFVILDDDPNDEMGKLKLHLVKCDGYAGLTAEDCQEVIRRLSSPATNQKEQA